MAIKNLEFVQAKDIIQLRHRILRPGLPLELSQYAFDNENTTFHIAVIIDNTVTSCGTFVQSNCPIFPLAKKGYQLRGMATDKHFSGQGHGSAILKAATDHLKKINSDLLWFNARQPAFDFYLKNGFTITGHLYDMPYSGPHKLMYKWL